jgi:hypothetical protein
MREYLERIGPQDRALLIDDTPPASGRRSRQAVRAVAAGRDADAQLDQIVRQKDPELLKAVEHLAKNETSPASSYCDNRGASPSWQTHSNASAPLRRATLYALRAR